jgi:hypothetical protein
MNIKMSFDDWKRIGEEMGWTKIAKKTPWIGEAVKKPGRFTTYCKKKGYKGACKECAQEAMKSDDASIRGMASFYMNVAR